MKTAVAELPETSTYGELVDSPISTPMPPTFPSFLVTGKIVGFAPSVGPLVDFPGNNAGVLLLARSVVPVSDKSIGREAFLGFEENDLTRPLIFGLLQRFDDPDPDPSTLPSHPGSVEVNADGSRLVLAARDEIVLRCGRASITLTAAGKVLLRGDYLLSRSTGANRIKGGSVQIN